MTGPSRQPPAHKSPAPQSPASQPPAPKPPAPEPPAPQPADYDEHGVPSLEYVRDKIEGRFATALGGTELAEETAQARSLQDQQAEREKAAQAKLEEIRRSLRGDP